jgi:alpha/beta superfamily hydrolase
VTEGFRPPRPEKVVIAGPAGALEAVVEEPHGHAGERFGVICHPHPLHGGTLTNKVVHTLARTLQEAGVSTVRFNFRGVGASAGSFDEGVGETADAIAVVEWARKRWAGAAPWLGGFSFGGAVAIRAAGAVGAQRLITVSPAIGRIEIGEVAVHCPWLIIQGDADDVVEPQSVLDWASRLNPAPAVTVLAGAGHFFHGRLHDLRNAVMSFLANGSPAGEATQ